MPGTDSLTPYQQLRLLNDLTGLDVRLKAHDRIDKVVLQLPTMAAVFITTHRVAESPSTIKLTGRGIRMVSIMAGADGTMVTSDLTSWEPDFQPVVIDQRVPGKSIEEWTDSLEWAAMCARPGAGQLGQRDHDSVQRDCAKSYNRVHGTGAWESY